MDRYICDTLNPVLAYYKPEVLTLLEMESFDLGSTPPQFHGIKCHDFTSDTVMIDLELRLVADSTSAIVAKAVTSLISVPVMLRHVNLIATLRIEMKGIRGVAPCFDELHISFARAPKFDFDLAAGHKTFDLAHIPIIDRAIEDMVHEVLGWYVFPQTKMIPMRAVEDIAPVKKDDVVGVLFVTILGARNIKNVKKSHHPSLYVESKFNGVIRRTKTSKCSEWYENNVFKFLVKQDDIDSQKSLILKIKQKRMIGGSFMIGATHIPISHIKIGEMLEEWISMWSSKGRKEASELHVKVDLRITNRAADIHNFTNAAELLKNHHQLLASEEIHEEIRQRKESDLNNRTSAFIDALSNAHKMLEDGLIDKEEFQHIRTVLYDEDKHITNKVENSFRRTLGTPTKKTRKHSKFKESSHHSAALHPRSHHDEVFAHADTEPVVMKRRTSLSDGDMSHLKSGIEHRNRALSESPAALRKRSISSSQGFRFPTRKDSESSENSVQSSFSTSRDTSEILSCPDKNRNTFRVTLNRLSEIPSKKRRKLSSPTNTRQYYARLKFHKEVKRTPKIKCKGNNGTISWNHENGTVSFSMPNDGKDDDLIIEILRKRSILSDSVLGVVKIDNPRDLLCDVAVIAKAFPVEVVGKTYVEEEGRVEGSCKMDLTLSWVYE